VVLSANIREGAFPGKLLKLRCCIALACLLFAEVVQGQRLALTFDDGPDMADTITMDAAARNAAILQQLSDAHLKSILFVTRTDADQKRIILIRQWGIEGHEIGNHTATHPIL
jgi:peptidoglycan-N-acetylglucosamine deacetylase